jgi:AhpD family alkylhydroperoxidase
MSDRFGEKQRPDYIKLAPEGFARMTELGHYLNTGTGLEANLLDLIRLLASLLNGCEYCVGLHRHVLTKLNETAGRIDGLTAWRESDAYTQRERAALAWTEAVTNIQQGHAPDAVYDEVRRHFSDVETVNLTLAITTINAWNRIAIAFRAQHEEKKAAERSAIDDDGGKVAEDDE